MERNRIGETTYLSKKKEFEDKYGTGEETVLISESKYNIPVYFYEAYDVSLNRVIVLVHWHESNHKAMYPLAEEFLQLGYDVILYDQRSHGENTAETVSFGLWESKESLIGSIITGYGSMFSKLINGFAFEEADIVKMMGENQIPTMIIHSQKDMKCPFYMGEELYRTISHDNKKFEIYEESEHLFAYWDESERYIESVISFIEEFK